MAVGGVFGGHFVFEVGGWCVAEDWVEDGDDLTGFQFWVGGDWGVCDGCIDPGCGSWADGVGGVGVVFGDELEVFDGFGVGEVAFGEVVLVGSLEECLGMGDSFEVDVVDAFDPVMGGVVGVEGGGGHFGSQYSDGGVFDVEGVDDFDGVDFGWDVWCEGVFCRWACVFVECGCFFEVAVDDAVDEFG